MIEAKVTIGHIARAAGVNIETVRYYQRRGLVGLPPKRALSMTELFDVDDSGFGHGF